MSPGKVSREKIGSRKHISFHNELPNRKTKKINLLLLTTEPTTTTHHRYSPPNPPPPPLLVHLMSADVARSHGEGEDRPPLHHVPSGCMGCFANRGKGKRKPNLGGTAAGRLNTRDKTQNLSLKEITDTKGPVPIQFELRNKQTVMPLGDHAAHWSSYIGEVIRGVPLYYLSWLKVPKERKAALITDIGVSYPFMFISLSCSFI
nr:hypothetical protein [Tanacetum cinerariifolium]